jgi:hypothetical protein
MPISKRRSAVKGMNDSAWGGVLAETDPLMRKLTTASGDVRLWKPMWTARPYARALAASVLSLRKCLLLDGLNKVAEFQSV